MRLEDIIQFINNIENVRVGLSNDYFWFFFVYVISIKSYMKEKWFEFDICNKISKL